MASGAIFGALNSLYASVDARRREIATLRAIGFNNGPIIVSVLLEGMVLALPGAFLGALVAWVLFNGNVVDVAGLIFKLTVTPRLLWISILWAMTIGLIGASLPALRAARSPSGDGAAGDVRRDCTKMPAACRWHRFSQSPSGARATR